MSKFNSVKVEDKEHESNDLVEEDFNVKSAIKALMILVLVVIVGFLILFGLEKFKTYNSTKTVSKYIKEVVKTLDNQETQNVFLLENLEFDLIRFRDEYIDNKMLSEKINSTIHRIQDIPVYVKIGTQFRSWATSEVFKTEFDSIVVPYRDRGIYSFRTVYQPSGLLESKAYELQKAHTDWTKEDCLRIVNKKIWAGMTKVQLQSSWGQPKTVDKNYSFSSNSEQWVYGSMGPYVYLENGIVTSWQE